MLVPLTCLFITQRCSGTGDLILFDMYILIFDATVSGLILPNPPTYTYAYTRHNDVFVFTHHDHITNRIVTVRTLYSTQCSTCSAVN